MRQILLGITLIVVRFLVALFARIDRRVYTKFIERLCFAANSNSGVKDFVTLLIRPKKDFRREIPTVAVLDMSAAILIQGQIVQDGQFTIETIRLYRKIFPNIPLVVATWEAESVEDLRVIASLGARIILCKKPSGTGFLNFNLQRETTVKGLEAVRELGVARVLKTRSDQRIYNRFAIVFLQAMLLQFPPRNNVSCKGRIFILSTTTLTNFPLHVCDMLQFGFIDDVCKFWGVPAHEEDIERERFVSEMEGRLRVSEMLTRESTIPEVCLGRFYASLLYGEESLSDPKYVYQRMMHEAIGIVDQGQLDLSWPKYNSIEAFRDYQIPWLLERFTFEKWLSLYSDTVKNVISYDPKTII
jgi:hypothetical protein